MRLDNNSTSRGSYEQKDVPFSAMSLEDQEYVKKNMLNMTLLVTCYINACFKL